MRGRAGGGRGEPPPPLPPLLKTSVPPLSAAADAPSSVPPPAPAPGYSPCPRATLPAHALHGTPGYPKKVQQPDDDSEGLHLQVHYAPCIRSPGFYTPRLTFDDFESVRARLSASLFLL